MFVGGLRRFRAKLGYLIVGPQPAHEATLFLRRPLLVQRHQPRQQFLFRRLLVRRLVRARQRRARLADQARIKSSQP
jgi:hypothetical protein